MAHGFLGGLRLGDAVTLSRQPGQQKSKVALAQIVRWKSKRFRQNMTRDHGDRLARPLAFSEEPAARACEHLEQFLSTLGSVPRAVVGVLDAVQHLEVRAVWEPYLPQRQFGP